MESGNVIETIEAIGYRISLFSDNIIRVYSKEKNITKDHIIDLMSHLEKIANGSKIQILIDPTEELSMTTEARKAIVPTSKSIVKAMAVISRKNHIKAIGNLVLRLDKPPFPLKMFNSNSEAEEWLKSL